tara:strand:- start:2840 stop:3937 length:1098 start_codon:yes stop_codon:yes gene_type:complete
MPTIQSAEIWKESGRYADYGEEMLRIKDRQNREMLYGPTNEELITEIFRSSIKSYKSLPQLLYHIQWKFRDELRPRFGVMRCREFYMKDAYSFDLDDKSAQTSYNKMFFAYLKTFKRLGLKAIPMAADTGPIGGDLSHEFVILADTGESKIYSDKRIFDVDVESYDASEKSIEKMRSEFGKYYAVTDDKFNKKEFDQKVNKKDQLETRGIEVGHIFYFGDKYSKPLNGIVSTKEGPSVAVKMGSYGVGVSRLVGAIIEAKYNNETMVWPNSIAPFQVAIIPNVKKNDKSNLEKAEKLYKSLKKQSIDVLLDDTDESLSYKFKKFDLLGIPNQIIVGSKSTDDKFEFKKPGMQSENLKIQEIIKKL